jgi:hypothetical protein
MYNCLIILGVKLGKLLQIRIFRDKSSRLKCKPEMTSGLKLTASEYEFQTFR